MLCLLTCRLPGGSDPGLLRGGLGPDSGPSFGGLARAHGRGGRRGGDPAFSKI